LQPFEDEALDLFGDLFVDLISFDRLELGLYRRGQAKLQVV
jgi:hypothetical protein